MDKYKFGNRLCSLREEKGLSQKDLAKILDVSDKAISKWENGQSIPRMETLEKLAELFNVSLDVLIKDDETEMERHKVKRDIFRNKEKGSKKVFFYIGIGSLVLIGGNTILDAIVYFFFGKSDFANLLLQNTTLFALPIGILTVYGFVNSWLLRFISGFRDFHFRSTSNCVSVENLAHRGLSMLNGISCIFSLLPFILSIASFDLDISLIEYVAIYSASFVLLTINFFTSEYANITLYFTENGIFEKSIDYGDFHPYSKLENVESNINDINSSAFGKLKVSFAIDSKKYKVSVAESDVEKVSKFLKLGYDEKKIEENSVKPTPLFYILFGIGAVIMALGFILFLSNMQIGTQDIDYTKPSTEFVTLDGGTSVVKYNDRLYAFTEQNCAVDVFDMDGNFIYANQVPIHQKGLAEYYLVNDNLYIIDRDYNVYRYDLNGKFLGRCVVHYGDDEVITISRYDENDKLETSFELDEDSAWIVYFDNDEIIYHGDDYITTYDGNKFDKSYLAYHDSLTAELVDDALYLETNTQKEFDGVEYFVFRGDLYAESKDDFKELHSVPLFTWYRHSIISCWLTAAFGMAFIIVSTRIYIRVKNKKSV